MAQYLEESGLISNAITTAVELGKELEGLSAVRIIPELSDRRETAYQIEKNVKFHPKTPNAKKHVVHTIGDLVKHFHIATGSGSTPTVWIAENAVVLLLNDTYSDETVTMPLLQTKAFETLKEIEKSNTWHKQPEFIRLLRTDLRDIGIGPDFLNAVRNVRFKSTAESSSDIQHNKESMGRSISNEVTGAGVIPEELTVYVPVLANPELKQEATETMRLVISVDSDKQLFQILATRDELMDVAVNVGKVIYGRLAAYDIPESDMFFGKP